MGIDKFSGGHKEGYIRIKISVDKKSICPFCNHENNHIATISNCSHLVKVTDKRIAFYQLLK